METIQPNSFTNLELNIQWQSQVATHNDCYYAPRVNFWRDFLPVAIESELTGKTVGHTATTQCPPGELLPDYLEENVFEVFPNQFDKNYLRGKTIEPKFGRFYPIAMLIGIPGFYRENVNPCRCLNVDGGKLRFDLNHPLAAKNLTVTATVLDVWQHPSEERGGRSVDWPETALRGGPGLQACWENERIDFFSGEPFKRLDDSQDDKFYTHTRLVPHIDSKASEIIARLYGELLQPDTQVLDLMSSWQSHLPDTLNFAKLTGLGMNEEELQENSRLTDYLVHDLNQTPTLPFESNSFDAVICSLSVEYLIHPIDIFDEVARVLKPQGKFILTFSNRWFPPKVIEIWHELHEFERMGLVLEYFLKSGKYQNFATYSMRNYPRPENDKHINETSISDPVFAVWGEKMSS